MEQIEEFSGDEVFLQGGLFGGRNRAGVLLLEGAIALPLVPRADGPIFLVWTPSEEEIY